MSNIKQDTKVFNSGSKTMFKNPFIERLTRTHFLVPIILYTAISIIAIVYSLTIDLVAWYNLIWLYLLGAFFFSFIEYCLHRFLFHFEVKTEKQQQIQYNIHGVHHEFPKDKDRLVMPPVISIFLAAFFYFLFYFFLGKVHNAFFAGFIEGYCIYLTIHYAVHRFRTPGNFLKILWQHHSLHHYGRNDTAYAVSMPLWDYLFGTMPRTRVN